MAPSTKPVGKMNGWSYFLDLELLVGGATCIIKPRLHEYLSDHNSESSSLRIDYSTHLQFPLCLSVLFSLCFYLVTIVATALILFTTAFTFTRVDNVDVQNEIKETALSNAQKYDILKARIAQGRNKLYAECVQARELIKCAEGKVDKMSHDDRRKKNLHNRLQGLKLNLAKIENHRGTNLADRRKAFEEHVMSPLLEISNIISGKEQLVGGGNAQITKLVIR